MYNSVFSHPSKYFSKYCNYTMSCISDNYGKLIERIRYFDIKF